MAYTALVTKESVSQIKDSIYSISIKMVVNDGVQDVFETTVSAQHNANSPDLAGVRSRLVQGLQIAWDKYLAERGLFVAATFDTMVGNIQTSANTYVNK